MVGDDPTAIKLFVVVVPRSGTGVAVAVIVDTVGVMIEGWYEQTFFDWVLTLSLMSLAC